MELNLRKARKLEAKIGTVIKSKQNDLSTVTQVRVNEADVKLVVANTRLAFFDELKSINDLIKVKQDIRDLIASANFNVGVDILIAQKVLLESKVTLLNNFTSTDTFDVDETNDQIAISKKQLDGGQSMYARATLSVSFLSKLDKDKLTLDLLNTKKEIEALEDKLAELNYSAKIKLDATSTKLLQDSHLI